LQQKKTDKRAAGYAEMHPKVKILSKGVIIISYCYKNAQA